MNPSSGRTVQALDQCVERELAAFAPDVRARFARFTEVISRHSVLALPAGSVKSFGGGLWELRLTGRDGIARAIYLTASGTRAVILRAFVKKTEDIARERAREVR